MNLNLPPDKGKKKRKQYWNYCISFAAIACITALLSFATVQRPTGEYVTIDGYQYYQCEDGELIFDPEEEIVIDNDEDCLDGSDEVKESSVFEGCYGLSCCLSMLFGISALSTKNDDRVYVIQQPAAYTPVIQQTIVQPKTPPQQASPKEPDMFAKTKGMWVQEAQNLELARNWEGAAEAYEKAGLYAEAGRIRKEHLENSQPVVQIGKVGDTILHDSVMISEDSEKLE